MTESLQLKSLVEADGAMSLYLDTVELPEPGPDEVLIRVEAVPINPSDLGSMFGRVNYKAFETTGEGKASVLKNQVPRAALPAMKARLGKPLPAGNEGAGTVVAAGASDAAQALMGKTVSTMAGGMYSQYRIANAMLCLPLKEGTTAVQGCSSFVNPMTAQCMVENMRLDGYKGLVHTAGASNLGQMLNRICMADDVPLVNIVRRAEAVDLLKGMGAKYVINSSLDIFHDELTEALAETGAMLAFDATGGGTLANSILTCMERALSRDASTYSVYGSTVHKQVYLYGSLDFSPTELRRAYGMSWGVGGWLLPNFLGRLDPQRAGELRARVANEITTTFASNFKSEISLVDMLQADTVHQYAAMQTGEKYVVRPQA